MIGRCISLFISIILNIVLIFSLVLLISCFCLFVCPLYVTVAEYGGYFWTDRAVNLGHVENCLLFIAFRSVCLGGLNAAWWGYLIISALDFMAYAFYAMCLVWPVCVSGDVLLYS